MNKTEILNIVNEPSKHIQIVKIDGKDSVVYSSKFVELLELIPTMLTRADMVDMLTELKNKFIDKSWNIDMYDDDLDFECCYLNDIDEIIQEKINKLKAEGEERK